MSKVLNGFFIDKVCVISLFFYALLDIQASENSPNQRMGPNDQAASQVQQMVEIHDAASNGDVGKVSELLKKDPALLESRDDIGMTPLQVAARDGKVDVVKLLIEKGADINATTKMGNYDALAIAAKNGQKDIVLILLDKGADPNRQDRDGDTTITLAQNEGQTEIMALFKAHGYVASPPLNWVVNETPLSRPPSSWIIDSLKVSSDNKRVAWGARINNRYWIVMDGKKEKFYDGISKGFPIFSPDNKHVAYVAWVGDKRLIVVDGKEEKLYDDVGFPVFSPDGKRMAYEARAGNKWVVVVDGKEEKSYNDGGMPIFSPDSRRIAYGARAGNKWFVVVDGKTGKAYDAILQGSPIFSPDSTQVAYGAKAGNKWLVVVDGKEGKPYDGIGRSSLIFSPDGRRVAYGAKVDNKFLVVVDEKEGGPYDGIAGGFPIFSPDSKRVAYEAKAGNKWLVVVDGKEGVTCDAIGLFIFSPDGKRMAYPVKINNTWLVVIDGKEGKPYYDVGDLIFSTDSKRVAYVAKIDAPVFDNKTMTLRTGIANKESVVIDGQEQTPYVAIVTHGGGKVLFDAPDSFHYLAVNGMIVLVEEALQSPVATGREAEFMRDWKSALAAFNQAIQLDPQNANVLMHRALVKSQLGDVDGALKDYDQALAINPQDSAAFDYRGSLKYHRKYDVDGAIADFDHAISLNPNDGYAYGERGDARLYKEDIDGAIADFSQAIKWEPRNSGHIKWRGYAEFEKAFAKGSDENMEHHALDDLEKACDLNPNDQDYARIFIWLIEAKYPGQVQNASRDLTEVLRVRCGQPSDWPAQIEAFLTNTLSEDDFLKAAQVTDTNKRATLNAEVFFYVGIKHLYSGDSTEAASRFKQSVASGLAHGIETNVAMLWLNLPQKPLMPQ